LKLIIKKYKNTYLFRIQNKIGFQIIWGAFLKNRVFKGPFW